MTNTKGEIGLEKQCLEYTQQLGGELWKVRQVGQRSLNDRLLLLPGLPVVFVEFKDDDTPLTAGQLRKHTRLRSLGKVVWVVRSYEAFRARIAVIKQEMEHARLR